MLTISRTGGLVGFDIGDQIVDGRPLAECTSNYEQLQTHVNKVAAMRSDLEQRIKDERARIFALASKLDANRTPYIKKQLTFAGHILDDAQAGLRHAKEAPSHEAMWFDFIEMNIQNAASLRQRIEAMVNKYGGPENVEEFPKLGD